MGSTLVCKMQLQLSMWSSYDCGTSVSQGILWQTRARFSAGLFRCCTESFYVNSNLNFLGYINKVYIKRFEAASNTALRIIH